MSLLRTALAVFLMTALVIFACADDDLPEGHPPLESCDANGEGCPAHAAHATAHAHSHGTHGSDAHAHANTHGDASHGHAHGHAHAHEGENKVSDAVKEEEKAVDPFDHLNPSDCPDKLFTESELSAFDGKQSEASYLAILGLVFDVTSAPAYYGPNGAYGYLTGKDSSQNLLNMVEKVENPPPLSTKTPTELGGLESWIQRFLKKYTLVGKVVGDFFDESGNSTPERNVIVEKITQNSGVRSAKQAEVRRKKEERKSFLSHLPWCNFGKSSEGRKSVWCSERSGGKPREDPGLPRQRDGVCVCVPTDLAGDYPELIPYPGCDPNSLYCGDTGSYP